MPARGYDLDTAAEDVQTFIEALGPVGARGLDIVSHDTGSWIAHAHAAAYPDSVRRLVLSDAYIPGVSPAPPAGYPTAELNARQWHFYFDRIDGSPEALIHGREREFLSWFFGPVKPALRSRRPLTMPILTLGGSYADGDNLYRTMRQFTDDVRNRVFDGIGHHLPEECPREMTDEILAFWKDTP